MATTGEKLGMQILEFLGIPREHARRVSVNCECGQPASVVVEYLVLTDEHRVSSSFSRYKVVEAE